MSIIEKDKQYIASTYARFPVVLKSGKGSLITDEKGKEYIDLSSGIAVNTFGIADDIWVNAVTEAYPELKADRSFNALMDEISSIENEIQYSRTQYNEKATQFNKAIRKFPGSIFASMFGFEKAELFEASEGADKVPEVSF